MLGWSSVEALGLRFWRLTPFDVQHRDRRCRSRLSYGPESRLGQASRTTWNLKSTTNTRFRPDKQKSLRIGVIFLNSTSGTSERWDLEGTGQRHYVLARTHAVLWAHDSVDLPVCHSLIHAVNFEYQNVLSRQTAAVAGQKRAAQWKEPHG